MHPLCMPLGLLLACYPAHAQALRLLFLVHLVCARVFGEPARQVGAKVDGRSCKWHPLSLSALLATATLIRFAFWDGASVYDTA